MEKVIVLVIVSGIVIEIVKAEVIVAVPSG